MGIRGKPQEELEDEGSEEAVGETSIARSGCASSVVDLALSALGPRRSTGRGSVPRRMPLGGDSQKEKRGRTGLGPAGSPSEIASDHAVDRVWR